MSSRFVEKRVTTTGKGGAFQASEKPLLAWFQFVPALVIDVITNEFHRLYNSDRDLNSVIVKVHVEDAFGKHIQTDSLSTEKYYPLFSRITDPPIKGEQVLVCTFGGINYYMGPVNTVNLPNFNPDNLKKSHVTNVTSTRDSSITGEFGLSQNYRLSSVKKLGKIPVKTLDNIKDSDISDIHSDMTIEGRHGNSMRIGTRDNNPYIIISNARNHSISRESLYDGSIFSMTNFGPLRFHFVDTVDENNEVIPFQVPSDMVEENNRIIGSELYNYNYAGNQILQMSDKITIGTRTDSIFLSSFQNVVVGAGNNLEIKTNKATIIESSNIYLGSQAQGQNEPLVLGTQITDILKEIVSILETMKVTGCIAGLSGPPAPDVLAKITNLKTTLDAVPHLSEYHFIEDNGQKAE